MTGRRWTVALLGLGLLACTDSTQPSYVADVRLDPDYTGTGVGETVVLEATPLGENGDALAERADRVEFRVLSPDVASIEPLGEGRVRVTGLKLGTTGVVASLGRGAGSTPFIVHPPGLDHIRVEPSSATLDRPGFQQFRVLLFDEQGNEMSDEGFVFKWTTSNPNVVDFIYDYTNPLGARTDGPGTATVTVRVGAHRASASVTVR